MIIFAHLISFSIGWLSINALFKNEKILNPSLHIPLAFGAGLGISALLTFFTFLTMNQFNAWVIIGLNLILLIILFIINLNLHLLTPAFTKIIENKKDFFFNIGVALFFILLFPLIFFLSQRHPFGEWDAWALWNMKTKFLIFAGTDWRVIFTQLHWHTQPDYPLLLPFIHTWSFCFTQKTLYPIPRITAVTFAALCPMLLYGGLNRFIKKEIAFLATGLLIANPFYMFLSTAQYADILLAFYLLAGLITVTLALRTHNKKIAMLSGFLLGLMSFTKNEGIALMLLIIGITFFYLLYEKFKLKKSNFYLSGYFFSGLCITASATIIFKVFLAPPNKDILADFSNVELTFFNLKGLIIIKNALLHEFFHQRWCLIWMFLVSLFLIKLPDFFKKECKVISLFFIFYFLVILYIYLTTINFDLAWRLKSTLHRILFYLLPSLIFFSFYVHWRTDEIKTS